MRKDFWIGLAVAGILGGLWGGLASFILPYPFSTILSVIGGVIIGWNADKIARLLKLID